MDVRTSAEEYARKAAEGERVELVDVAPIASGEDTEARGSGLLRRLRRQTIVPTHTVVAVTPVLIRFYPTYLDKNKGFVPAGEARAYPRSQVDILLPPRASDGEQEVNFILPNGTTEVLRAVQHPDAWPRFIGG